MAFKKAIRRKRQKPSTRNKRKRKTITRKKRALKKKTRKVPKKKQKKNQPRIKARKLSRKKTVRKKSNITRKSSKRIQSRNTLVRKKIIKRRSPTGHTKKLVRRKSSKEQIVNRTTARKCTQSKSCMSQIIRIENIERSRPAISCIDHINSTSKVNGSIPRNNYKKKNSRTTMHKSIPESSCKNAILRIRNMLRSKQSFKNNIRSTSNFQRCKPRRIQQSENAFYQPTVNNRGPREEQYEKYRRIEPLCQLQPDRPSSDKLQSNKQLLQPLMRNDMLVERLPISESKSEEILTNKPAASNIPNWLQEELNESTSLEPISCSIRAPLPQNHYYEIQEVCYECEGELQLIHLRDIGLFDNFEAARERFIQNYFKKIKNGCKPVRSSDVSYPMLYEAIEASRNSIYGYWLRVSEPESGGIHEMFLRKKQWCNSSHAKGA